MTITTKNNAITARSCLSGLNVNDFAGFLGGLGVTCFIERAVFLGGFIIRVAGKLIHLLLAIAFLIKI